MNGVEISADARREGSQMNISVTSCSVHKCFCILKAAYMVFFFNRELSLSAGFQNWGPVVALDITDISLWCSRIISSQVAVMKGAYSSGIPKTEELDGGERQ